MLGSCAHRSNRCCRDTRSSAARTAFDKRAFVYAGRSSWNKLPRGVKSLT